mmetsp:Transcript_29852/g.77056  ORF Transcript_29852/g.77056 Transcript_29852/m.77056 type:complete len:97 (-) Transcript_29852:520-810(-)
MRRQSCSEKPGLFTTIKLLHTWLREESGKHSSEVHVLRTLLPQPGPSRCLWIIWIMRSRKQLNSVPLNVSQCDRPFCQRFLFVYTVEKWSGGEVEA